MTTVDLAKLHIDDFTPYQDAGFELRAADRVVVLLTQNHGLVRGVAKGVRKAKSRFGSRLQPFVEVDALIYPGRGLSTIA